MAEQNNKEIEIFRERAERTPITEVTEAIGGAFEFYVWLFTRGSTEKSNEDFEKDFVENIYGKCFDDPENDGDLAVDRLGTIHKEIDGDWEENTAPLALFEIMLVVVSYATQAVKAQENDNLNLAWTYAVDAQYWWGILSAEFSRKQEPSEMSLNAMKAVKAKLAKDPKQQEKIIVKECWNAWQKKPRSYKYKSDFAKDMLDKCEHLESQKKIEDWCRDWEKTHSARTKLILLD